MELFYNQIKSIITAGDIQNSESVKNQDLVAEAIALEKAKYNVTFIMDFFYKSTFGLIKKTLNRSENENVLDVGSAIGEVISKIAVNHSDCNFKSIDIMAEAIQFAQKNFSEIKNLSFEKRDFIHDSFKNENYELVMCMQTLEHIEDQYLIPFVDRLFSVSNKSVLVSVPREPFWCLANLIRFKYWSRLGNSPHHIQHWSKISFIKLIQQRVELVWGTNYEIEFRSPLLLWTFY